MQVLSRLGDKRCRVFFLHFFFVAADKAKAKYARVGGGWWAADFVGGGW